MANPLILLAILGGGFYYLSQQKKTPSTTTTTPKDKVQLPDPNANGFKIVNCESIVVSDPIKFKQFTDGVLGGLLKSSNYNVNDTKAPFDFAKIFLKNISPICASLLESNTPINKDQFVISYIFLQTGFSGYLSQFVMTDGKQDPDRWQKYFKTKDDHITYVAKASSLFEAWYSPYFNKFKISAEELALIIVKLASEGKYP